MGLDLGSAMLKVDLAPGGLAAQFRMQNDAMLGFVDASDTQMTSLVAAAHNKVSPVKFEGVYTKDDRVREIDVGYDAAGMIDRARVRPSAATCASASCRQGSTRMPWTRWRRCCACGHGSARSRKGRTWHSRSSTAAAATTSTPARSAASRSSMTARRWKRNRVTLSYRWCRRCSRSGCSIDAVEAASARAAGQNPGRRTAGQCPLDGDRPRPRSPAITGLGRLQEAEDRLPTRRRPSRPSPAGIASARRSRTSRG